MGALTATDVDRLAKLLGLLGSDHLGERAAAGAAADRLIKGRGCTWREILQPHPTAYQPPPHTPPPPPPPAWTEDVKFIWRNIGFCTAWEINFITGIKRFPRPSEKQRAVLTNIATRLRDLGAE